MSLADRLESVRRSQQPPAPAGPTQRTSGRRRTLDPFGEVKGRVHQTLIDNLGPRLYDPHLPEAELAAQVRQTLQETIAAEQTPLSRASLDELLALAEAGIADLRTLQLEATGA